MLVCIGPLLSIKLQWHWGTLEGCFVAECLNWLHPYHVMSSSLFWFLSIEFARGMFGHICNYTGAHNMFTNLIGGIALFSVRSAGQLIYTVNNLEVILFSVWSHVLFMIHMAWKFLCGHTEDNYIRHEHHINGDWSSTSLVVTRLNKQTNIRTPQLHSLDLLLLCLDARTEHDGKQPARDNEIHLVVSNSILFLLNSITFITDILLKWRYSYVIFPFNF